MPLPRRLATSVGVAVLRALPDAFLDRLIRDRQRRPAGDAIADDARVLDLLQINAVERVGDVVVLDHGVVAGDENGRVVIEKIEAGAGDAESAAASRRRPRCGRSCRCRCRGFRRAPLPTSVSGLLMTIGPAWTPASTRDGVVRRGGIDALLRAWTARRSRRHGARCTSRSARTLFIRAVPFARPSRRSRSAGRKT